MNKLLPAPLIAFAWLGYAQTTTIEVPQGSGVLPTVGQVNCLEELGSGRLCAATYECSEGSGRLWGDLANHDGRRAIGKDSPVARGRNCTITVDGRAAVRWLTAYSPGGRTGELVGLTTSEDALRPVQSVQRQGGEGAGRLIDYILERHDTTLPEYVEMECGHIRQGHQEHVYCVSDRLRELAYAIDLPDNPFTRCMVDAEYRWCEEVGCEPSSIAHVTLIAYSVQFVVDDRGLGRRRLSLHNRNSYASCLPLAEELLAENGLEFYQVDGRGSWFMRLRE